MNQLKEDLEDQIEILIELNLMRLNKCQIRNIISGDPDEACKKILLDFISKLISKVSSILKKSGKTLTKKLVRDCVSTVPKAFVRVLNSRKDITSSHSCNTLTFLITKDVLRQVKSNKKCLPQADVDLIIANCCKFIKELCEEKMQRNGKQTAHPIALEDPSISLKKGEDWSSQSKFQKSLSEAREAKIILLEKLVEDLIRRIFKKSDTPLSQSRFESCRKRLYTSLSKEAEKLECYISAENLEGLDKKIYKRVQKHIKTTSVWFLESEGKLFENIVADTFKSLLLKMKVVCKGISCCLKTAHVFYDTDEELQTLSGEKSANRSAIKPFSIEMESFKEESLKSKTSVVEEPDLDDTDSDLFAKKEKCNIIINQYLTALIPYMFKKAGYTCSKENQDHLFKRMYDEVWNMCKAYNFNFKNESLKNLVKVTYINLINFSKYSENVTLMCMNLEKSACDLIVAKTFEKHMLKKRSKFARFISKIEITISGLFI